MFTVIFVNDNDEKLISGYRYLFKPFEEKGLLGFCHWDISKDSISTACPDLLDLIRAKDEWRAIILNCDSVFENTKNENDVNIANPINPFDFRIIDQEEKPHESKIPLIRLCHMLGGYSINRVIDYKTGYEYADIDNNDEQVRISIEDFEKQDEEKKKRIKDNTYLKTIFIPNEYSAEEKAEQERIYRKYYLPDKRPVDIILMATRQKIWGDANIQLLDSWDSYRKQTDLLFAQKNNYPSNCRFIISDVSNRENSLYQKELLEYFINVLTISINDLDPSSFQGYYLYKTNVKFDIEEFSSFLSDHLNKLEVIENYVKDLSKLEKKYSFDEEDKLIDKVVVNINAPATTNLNVATSKIGLANDCPISEEYWWTNELREKKEELSDYIKKSSRSINKEAKRVNLRSKEYIGIPYKLTQFQIDDLNEDIYNLENSVINHEFSNAVDKKKVIKELNDLDYEVKNEIEKRLDKLAIILGAIVMAFITLLGFVPHFIRSYIKDFRLLGYSFALFLISLVVVLVGGFIVVLIQRFRLIRKIKKVNSLLIKTSNNVSSYVSNYSEYFKNILKHFKGISILDGMEVEKEKIIEDSTLLIRHLKAVKTAIERDENIFNLFALKRTFNIYLKAPEFFDLNIEPKNNKAYDLPECKHNETIPMNDTGDCVFVPYPFIKKLILDKDNVFLHAIENNTNEKHDQMKEAIND